MTDVDETTERRPGISKVAALRWLLILALVAMQWPMLKGLYYKNFKSEEKQAPPVAPAQVPETPGGAALVHEFIQVEGAQLYDSDTGAPHTPHAPKDACALDARKGLCDVGQWIDRRAARPRRAV